MYQATLLVFLLLLFNVYDVVATEQALALGVTEANIFVQWILNKWGFIGLIAVKLGFISILFLGIKGVTGMYMWALSLTTFIYFCLSLYHYFGVS